MADINDSVTQNLLPVQAYFNVDGSFNTFIGQNKPFYATANPIQSGLTITNSTLDSSPIGSTSPSTGVFTNITTTTGQITTQPTGATDIVNLLALQSYAAGISWKQPVACATLANITLSGLQTIDGYTTLSGDRVIVKNQSNNTQNGIYIASSGAWSRSSDADAWSELVSAIAFVEYGSQAGSAWFCTVTPGGTIGTTPITWAQFTTSATYSAGTGLTLTGFTFSITNVGTASTYGSASSVPVFTTNAQGQVTSVTNTSIAIANTQVSGLGTMSTQNANNVSITGGSITGTPISGSTVGGTTITASTQFSGPGTGLTGTASGLSIGGSAASATTAGSVTNSVTFNNGGTGGASGSTFNGSVAQTISYNTIGAPSTTGTGANGTWGISISGNAATVTNGVYTTGSYSNPSWITSILGSIVSGAVASATTATNVAGGLAGSLPYQSGAGATTFLGIGSANYVLTSSGTAPQYVAQSTLSVGSASTATTSTNLAGGVAGAIPYQSGASTTSFTAAGTTGQVLTSAGTGTPTWTTPTSYATVTDDTTTNSTRYPLFANQTSGNLSTEYTSSTKLQFNPSTGVFTATGFSGSGASLTSLTAGNLSGTIPSGVLGNSSLYIGTTAVPLNSASGSISSLAVNISGSASSATTATTATNATNIAITDNTSSASTYYPVLSLNSSGNNAATTSSTKLSFVPSTGVLSATSFTGAGTGLTGTASSLSIGGNAATATTATSATTATNIAGGANGSVPYQTGSGATTFLAAGSNGYILTLSGGVPTWAAAPAPSKVLQVVQGSTSTQVAVTSTGSTTATGLSVSITPLFSTSKILVFVSQNVFIQGSSQNAGTIYLYRNGSQIGTTGSYPIWATNSSETGQIYNISYLDSPATTSSTTYATYQSMYSGTKMATQRDGGTASTIILMEIAQ